MSIFGPVAPIGRALDLHSSRCEFESHQVHKIIKIEHSWFYINYIRSLKYNKLCRGDGIGKCLPALIGRTFQSR